MNVTLLRVLVWAVAVITVVSGATQIVVPGAILDFLDAENTGTARHFFAIVGMFMVLFGGMTYAALLSTRPNSTVLIWASLQKFGASAAVFAGIANDILSGLAAGVAAFDLASGVIILALARSWKS